MRDKVRIDGRGVTDIRRLSAVTEEYTSLGVPVKVAIVAPGDLEFGMSRMYELLQSRSINTLRVFRERSLAERWIADQTGTNQ